MLKLYHCRNISLLIEQQLSTKFYLQRNMIVFYTIPNYCYTRCILVEQHNNWYVSSRIFKKFPDLLNHKYILIQCELRKNEIITTKFTTRNYSH